MPSSKGKPDKPPGKPDKPPVIIVIPPPEVVIPPTNESHQLTGQRAIPMVGRLTPVQSLPVATSTTRATAATAVGSLAPSGGAVTPPQTGQAYIPPSASFTNRNGTWTMVGGVAHLNGVSTATIYDDASGIKLELLNGDVLLNKGSFWTRYFYSSQWIAGYTPSNPVPPANTFASISLYGSNDPATSVMAADMPYIGPANTPDNWELDITSLSTFMSRVGHTMAPGINPYNPEFSTDSATGIHYMRFSNDPALYDVYDGHNQLLTCWMSLNASDKFDYNQSGSAARLSHNTRYLLWIEDDVGTAIDEVGLKLPGLTNEGPGFSSALERIKWRMFHYFETGNTFMFGMIPEAEENYIYVAPDRWGGGSGGAPVIAFGTPAARIQMKTNRWHVIEQRAVLNTVGQANGQATVWFNGNKIYERSDVIWRKDDITKLIAVHVDVYHGGRQGWNGPCHYRIARIATSSSYIGVPAELLAPVIPSGWPLWRTQGAAKPVNSIHSIAGTANMAGLPDQTGEPPSGTVGRTRADVDNFNGCAWDPAGVIWYVGLGGHGDGWSNKAAKCDLRIDSPTHVLEHAGTPVAQIPLRSGAGQEYYSDGKFTSRHSFYANHYIPQLNSVFLFYCAAQWSQAGGSSTDCVDSYHTVNKTYSTLNTWQRSGYAVGSGGGRASVCVNPSNGFAYLSQDRVWHRWRPLQASATAGWDVLPVNTAGLSQIGGWQSHATMVDPLRNRLVGFNNNTLQYIDLNTNVGAYLPITGAAIFDGVTDTINAGAAVYDPDGDRYLLFTGVIDDSGVIYVGAIFSITPGGASTKLIDILGGMNGWLTRVAYLPALGCVAFQRRYSEDVQYLVTRTVP